ncbi:GDP-mannose:cellobiosyl-diphosphopolyprenol alpha-mannosyltransferase [Pirellulimonas nuda]|uniref:GDP-mannose:cellobiosyl-diphosphopolyprenol alpha-mannosyltransferase n=1 Tax=Pirellulimonas nuda TaxID=2528009 RepID=A0A518D660_9BACT|nr:glycosyltransferase [Pirellulimonas nuda]QDU86960.1 GDP-mannose:cellobiosyl-diphosphopolyprenol alpha-mannosyltransferase [Pirellulimonas nuda]
MSDAPGARTGPGGSDAPRPLRVVQGIASLDPSGGGPPAVAVSLAAALASAGAEVTLAHATAEQGRARVAALIESTPGAEALKVVHGPLQAVLGGAEGGPPDIVHLHGFWEPWTFAAARAARGRAPYVLAPHGMFHPWSLRQKRLKKQVALRLGYGGVLRRAALLHALNRPEKEFLLKYEPRLNVTVIPNGVFPEALRSPLPVGSFRAGCPGLGDAPMVLFLSRLHHGKGLDILVDAMRLVIAELPAAKLVVVGPDAGYESTLRESVARHGLEGSVLVVGPKFGHDKLAALGDADCFCLPSRQEGFSIAITEALGSGVPCVVSDASNFPEVGEVGAGFVTSLDPRDVAEGILKVLRGDRRQMGDAGRRLVAERFTWPAVAQQTLAAYHNLVLHR